MAPMHLHHLLLIIKCSDKEKVFLGEVINSDLFWYLVPLQLLPCRNQFHPLEIIYFIIFYYILYYILLYFIIFLIKFDNISLYFDLFFHSECTWCLFYSPMQQPVSFTRDLHELFCCRHHLFQFIIITISSSWYSIVYKL